jgi:hypothetical protein
VAQALPGELDATKLQLRRLLSAAAAEVRLRSEAFARFELGRLGVVAEANPALLTTAELRSHLAASESARSLLWLDGTAGLLLAEALSLNAMGVAPELAATRLLAADIGDGRASIWRNGLAQLDLAMTQFIFGLDASGRAAIYTAAQTQERRYQKQAMAAIDLHTTDCCRKVHGQIQDLDQPFQLTGTPRFADRMLNPPFHYNCRTITTLYSPALERVGTSTEAMRAAARMAA